MLAHLKSDKLKGKFIKQIKVFQRENYKTHGFKNRAACLYPQIMWQRGIWISQTWKDILYITNLKIYFAYYRLEKYFEIKISVLGSHTYVQAIVVDKPASPLFAENMIVLSIPLSLPILSFMSKAPPFGDNKLFALCQKSAAQQQFSSTYDHHRHQHH